jgi:VIT1/CCC1 family predicted Fe2+/Mn2+ transporter
MFDTQQKSTGTGYTTTVAFLVVAFIFIPAALVFAGNYGYVSVSLAIAGSAICVGLAWTNWKKSQLSMPSIEIQNARVK